MRLFVLTAAALALAACASSKGPEAAKRFDSFDAVETMDFTGYDRVYLAPPVAGEDIIERIGARRPIRSFDERPLAQSDVDEQLAELDGTLRDALSGVVELTDRPGSGVLTVAATLTDLNANRPLAIELARNPGLSFQSIAAGDASVTFELSENGRTLALIDDSDNVNSLNDDPGIVAGVWYTANRFYRRTARRLADLLTAEG